MAAAAGDPPDRELEAEEEEQEDEADLGDEIGHLRGPHDAERLRLVRAEQHAREQVGRDRGQADTARHQAEPSQEGDGDGKQGEGHRVRRLIVTAGRRGPASVS